MAFDPTSGAEYPNLLNLARRQDPNGKIAKIVELLNKSNAIYDDAYWVEANGVTSHRTTIRADIPSGTWRKFNYGVKPIKSNTAQVDDVCGMLEARSLIDAKLAKLNGNAKEFMLTESMAILEGINQSLNSTLLYGDLVAYPDRFNGLTVRYGNLGLPTGKPSAQSYLNQVIGNGGTTADVQTSVWLIVWGPNTVHMFYPKGSTQGIESQDLGEIDAYDADGGVYRAYANRFAVTAGLCVRDWRYVVRICNIDVAAIAADATKAGAIALYRNMIAAINTIPVLSMGRACFYMNRAVKNILDIAAVDKSNAALKQEEVFGKSQTTFWGIPLKQCDSILLTEAVVS
jgi:hypothetical protein